MRLIGLAVVLSLILAPLAGEAQPAPRVPRIGILRPGSPPDPLVEAFREGLHELLDTGILNEDRYFDVFVEYAKASPEDILIQITASNRSAEEAGKMDDHSWVTT
jgi:hypothetical protein